MKEKQKSNKLDRQEIRVPLYFQVLFPKNGYVDDFEKSVKFAIEHEIETHSKCVNGSGSEYNKKFHKECILNLRGEYERYYYTRDNDDGCSIYGCRMETDEEFNTRIERERKIEAVSKRMREAGKRAGEEEIKKEELDTLKKLLEKYPDFNNKLS